MFAEKRAARIRFPVSCELPLRGEDEQRNEQSTALKAVPRDMELVRTMQQLCRTSVIENTLRVLR